MRYLLSIKTVFPRPGARVWYDDQRDVHRQIFGGDETVDYAFMRQDPEAADNRWLREAFENKIPVIYFLGIAPGRYQAVYPCVYFRLERRCPGKRVSRLACRSRMHWPHQRTRLERRLCVACGDSGGFIRHHSAKPLLRPMTGVAPCPDCPNSGCSTPRTSFPTRMRGPGQPIVPNGLPLSKIHHAAFDAHLIGIDPDYRLHVSDRLLDQNDGPMLEVLKQLNGRSHSPAQPG